MQDYPEAKAGRIHRCVHSNFEWTTGCEICRTGEYHPTVQYARHDTIGNGLSWLEKEQELVDSGEHPRKGAEITHNGFHFSL